MSLRCTVVTDISEAMRSAGEWEDLLSRSDNNEPTLSPLWISSWWSVFGALDGRSLRVGFVFDDRRMLGIFPLIQRRSFRFGVPFRTLEALPSGEAEQDEIVSEYIGLVSERGAEEVVAGAFGRALFAGAFGPWDELCLPSMNGETGAPRALFRALSREGAMVTLTERSLCPYVPLPGTFDEYLRALSSSRRSMVSRSIRDLERFSGGKLSYRVARTLEQLGSARATLERLHASRWGKAGAEGVFSSRLFSTFHDRVMRDLFERGGLELVEIFAGEEPVAALYNIVWNDKVYFYQSGRRADLPSKLRPGIAAHALAIRAAIEAGRREYDFLGGPARYKMDLALATRPLVDMRAARRSVREILRKGAERARARLIELRDRREPGPVEGSGDV